MIISAVVVKILGFLDISSRPISISENPQEGNLLLVLSDSGKKLCLRLTGSKSKTSLDDVNRYFENKIQSVIKQKEIDLAAAELEYVEEFEDLLEDAIENFKESFDGKPARDDLKKFKKEWKTAKASEIVYERRRFKKGSIIRVATSFGNKKEFAIFDKMRLPIIESRCIIFDKDGEPSTTGLYYFSQTDNQLPITINPIFNSNKEAIELFSLTLSPVANLGHVELLISHLYRTFDVSMEKNGKAYLNRIAYNFNELKEHKEEFEIVGKFNEFAKKKELTTKEDINEAKKRLEDVLNCMRLNPDSTSYIHISLNLLLTPEYFNGIELNSPLAKLKDSLINLNFSSYNPEDKNELKSMVAGEVSKLFNGLVDSKINAIYSTPALKLDEEIKSWGFMSDNVQQSSFILNSRSTAMLVKKAEKE